MSGKIIKIHTKEFDYKGYTHHVSKDEPQYRWRAAMSQDEYHEFDTHLAHRDALDGSPLQILHFWNFYIPFNSLTNITGRMRTICCHE